MTTVKIKLTRCHVCNATKVRPSTTAYVYCDYCGALTDFDFQFAISDRRSKLPGPQYEALSKALAPQLEAALKARDKEAHVALQRTLYEAYVTACPAACPPRVGDPAYRAKYIEHSARTATEVAFDPVLIAASGRQTKAMKDLAWVPGGPMGVTCRPDTFWALYETVLEMNEVSKGLAERTNLAELNPDGDTPVNSLIGLSLFVQGWLPYLKPPEVEALMKRSGLSAQYVEPAPVKDEVVPCGACKADVHRLEGATKCVCDGCGYLLRTDVVVPCSNCAANLLMPAEHTAFQCPFCATELRTMAWTMAQLQPR
jgi:hypothetical protein